MGLTIASSWGVCIGLPFLLSPPSPVCPHESPHPSLCTPLCQQNNTVTLSLYTDNCGLGPGDPLVSGIATVPLNPDTCQLAVAKLSGSPALQQGVKYWVVGSTDENQTTLYATWYGSNNAQFALNLGDGWTQFPIGTPGFLVQ